MREHETEKVRKLKEAFDELITSVDARKLDWNTERAFHNRIVECCDQSTSELYDVERPDIINVQQAYKTLGVAIGIEYALSAMGINTEHIGAEILHARIGHDERVEQIRSEHQELYKDGR
tara:strand:+ start:267 stop:626 length:360 start_codon:yes stop_codon:yes gene_type:complete